MARNRRYEVGLPSELANVLSNYTKAAAELPPFPETFEWSEIDGLGQSEFHTFRHAGVIKPIERRCSRDTNATLWQTKEGVAEWVDLHDTEAVGTPCGNATGIRTIEPGTYTCSYDDCDCRMDRDTAEQVVA